MKLWILTTFCTASLLILSGCGAKPTPKSEAVVDTTLPIVHLTENGFFIDTNSVAFEWQSLKDERVNGVYIYKTKMDSNVTSEDYYDTVNNRFSTHYLDTNIEPDTKYNYYFKTFSDEAESVKSEITAINSLPVLESVSWIHSIQDMPRSAKIIWRPHSNQKVKSYIIQRRTLEQDAWENIATIDGRLNAEYIDLNLKDKFVYKYRIKVLTYDNILSTPSQLVKVVTKELPKEVTNIVASRDLPRKIKITWDRSENKDFARYNLYRAQNVDGSYELIAKLHNNIFIDEINEDAAQYFYRVSVVDIDDLESKHNEQSIQGVTLSKPKAPAVFEAKLVDNKVQLIWSKVDPRTKSYIVAKSFKTSWFKEINEEVEGITAKIFVDTKIEPNITYYYQIFAVDENSIRSKPSIKVEFKSPAILESSARQSNTKQDKQIVTPSPRVEVQSENFMPIQDFN